MHERRRGGRIRPGPSGGARGGVDARPVVPPSRAERDDDVDREPSRAVSDSMVRWGFASFVAAVALAGFLILAAVIAVALEPPGWLQLVLGVLLAVGSAALAWLVASAIRSRDEGP